MPNLKFTSGCHHKETVLQNALRHDFVLLSPLRFSEFKGEKSLPVDAFSKKLQTGYT